MIVNGKRCFSHPKTIWLLINARSSLLKNRLTLLTWNVDMVNNRPTPTEDRQKLTGKITIKEDKMLTISIQISNYLNSYMSRIDSNIQIICPNSSWYTPHFQLPFETHPPNLGQAAGGCKLPWTTWRGIDLMTWWRRQHGIRRNEQGTALTALTIHILLYKSESIFYIFFISTFYIFNWCNKLVALKLVKVYKI